MVPQPLLPAASLPPGLGRAEPWGPEELTLMRSGSRERPQVILLAFP